VGGLLERELVEVLAGIVVREREQEGIVAREEVASGR